MDKLYIYVEIKGEKRLVGNISIISSDNAEFSYDEEYLHSQDARPISISLPLEEKNFNTQRTRNFFEGLLPEGFTRRCVASWLRKDEADYLSILSGLGRECLGAISVVEENNAADTFSYKKMTKEEVQKLAQEGATESAELVTRAHLSLTGASGKVGLYYDEIDNTWYLPLGNAPSTHIVKQSHVRLKHIVANEQLCLLTAKNLGIDVPDSFIIKTSDGDEEDVLFATVRYDRKRIGSKKEWDGLKIPYRLHQEDFSQALGIPASKKYEHNNENYLQKMFDLLRNYSASPIEDQLKLWDICIFNYLIGNTDNHVKNLSLLYSEDLNSIRLAPAYDIVSTIIYEESTDNMSVSIGGNYKLSDISRESFKSEAYKAGIGQSIAMKHFDDIVRQFRDALDSACEMLKKQGFEVDSIREMILSRGGIHYNC